MSWTRSLNNKNKLYTETYTNSEDKANHERFMSAYEIYFKDVNEMKRLTLAKRDDEALALLHGDGTKNVSEAVSMLDKMIEFNSNNAKTVG